MNGTPSDTNRAADGPPISSPNDPRLLHPELFEQEQNSEQVIAPVPRKYSRPKGLRDKNPRKIKKRM